MAIPGSIESWLPSSTPHFVGTLAEYSSEKGYNVERNCFPISTKSKKYQARTRIWKDGRGESINTGLMRLKVKVTPLSLFLVFGKGSSKSVF